MKAKGKEGVGLENKNQWECGQMELQQGPGGMVRRC